MAVLPKSHHQLRTAVASILKSPPKHFGCLYSVEDITIILNIAADTTNNDDIKVEVDSTLLAKAFSNNEQDEFILDYEEYFGFEGGRSVLYVYRERELTNTGGRRGMLYAGRFRSIEAGQDAAAERWNVDAEWTTVNTCKCLEWLTEKAEPLEILKDPLIADYEMAWWTMAATKRPVDLFDESTWQGVDFKILADLAHSKISIHAVRQQQIESLIQMCSLILSTNVDEATRTWRAMSLTMITRPFNREAKAAAEERRKLATDPKRKAKVDRVQGSERIRGFGNFCDRFNAEIDEELESFGEEAFNDLVEYISGTTNKRSRVDLGETKDKFSRGLNKKRKITKQQMNANGIDLTAEMDGAIKVRKLTSQYDEEMKVEVAARKIVLSKDWKEMGLKEKRDALRLDEMKHSIASGKARDGILLKDITQIVPVSSEMESLITKLNN